MAMRKATRAGAEMLASLISVSRDERRETRAVECAPSGRAIFGEGDDFGRETVGIVSEDIEFWLADIGFVEGDEKLRDDLHQGSVGDLEKVSEICVRVAA